ncbi:SusC/RagA family TonB-linked outer membrane protein [Fulvivirga lutimaris]|uniref:SusC/RagA family TonB-linked outer membrane protein n=1 Tax=Fulvivirga lutimaris TaxID=1819566 RepID=UPI0012BD3719|nr:SusC/RagA family TonB-linked outer membrane protein [Fulvivirga lutimaris]MTI39031.1 SusC/RagA family TonB-linked outer membrane protein [Fulvivirga lutimaris]
MKKIYSLFWVLLFLLGTTQVMQAQELNVTGKVTDNTTGDPVAGVNVVIKGTSQGTITDIDGNYSISVNSGATLLFSFIGFLTEEVVVSSATLNVAMSEDVTSLEEVVISGLASTVKRSNLANAVGTVSGEELTGTTGQSTLDGALYGKLTGVNIVASSGAPGGGTGVRLRGISSIKGNNQPLYIVDGVYISNAEIPSGLRFASGANRGNEENSANRIADLDPNDIENIEVLKGASAAAIYGTRANAGVIIITTKSGSNKKTRVTIGQDIGFNKVQRLIGMRDWDATKVTDTYGAAEAAIFTAAQAAGKVYDYEDEIYGETGLITNTKLNISGGNEKTSFYIGGSLRDEEGIVKNTGFNRKSIRLNLKHKVSDKFTVSTNSNYINTFTNRGFSGNENEGGLSYGYNLAYTRPWNELHPDEFGNYPDNATSFGNMLFVRDRAKNDDKINRFIQGVNASYDIIKSDNDYLKFTFNGGLDFFINESFIYVPETHQAQRGINNGFIGVGKNTFTNTNYQSFLVYDKFLGGGDIRLSTQAGISYLNFKRDLVYNQATQLIPGQTSLSQSGTQSINQIRQNEEEFGIIFQEELNFRDQIIATIGVRSDKSSLNGDPNKYYSFFKASLAANIHEFDFWNMDKISQLKIRAAYGETGSSASYGSLFTVFNSNNIEGNAGVIINPSKGTPNLFPETSSELEFGVDMGFLNGLISLEATYYSREVKDLLFDRSIPTSTGFSSTVLNDADLKNTGIELALTARPVKSNNIEWTSTTSFWKNESELTRLGVPPFPAPGNGFGLGLGTFYIQEGSLLTSIFQNVDGEATAVGNSAPDFQMSFFNQLHFLKNFDFSFMLHWKKGGDVLNLSNLLFDDGGINPAIDERGAQYADTYIEPAGYWRLREVALYYTIPKSTLAGLGNTLNNVKLGVSGRNLWTKTDYSGYDPEVSVNGSGVISNGLDVTPYPSSKQFYFHVALTF